MRMPSPDPRISRACAAFAARGALASAGVLRACVVFAAAGALATGGAVAVAAAGVLRAWTVSRAWHASGATNANVASTIHAQVRNGLTHVLRNFGMYAIANLIFKFRIDARSSTAGLLHGSAQDSDYDLSAGLRAPRVLKPHLPVAARDPICKAG